MDLLRHLGYFVAVAEELHFGRAAARLHMAQPPLSQRIQALERELGVRLFERSPRRVELTSAGRLLLEEARELLGRVDALRQVMDRARLGEVGTLRAGVPPDATGPVIAALVGAFRERCPDVRLELSEIAGAEQLRGLADRTLDVGILRHPFDAAWLEVGPVLHQPLGALLPRESPLARRRRLRLADLAAQDLVLFPRSAAPALYDELLSACGRHGYVPERVHHAANPEFALGLVLAGSGVALTEPAAARDERAVWRPLEGEPIVLRTSAAWPRNRANRAVHEFVAAAVAVLCEQGGMRLAAPPSAGISVQPRPGSGLLS
jgi:DNA-binding transcriptional LysR family regulator